MTMKWYFVMAVIYVCTRYVSCPMRGLHIDLFGTFSCLVLLPIILLSAFLLPVKGILLSRAIFVDILGMLWNPESAEGELAL